MAVGLINSPAVGAGVVSVGGRPDPVVKQVAKAVAPAKPTAPARASAGPLPRPAAKPMASAGPLPKPAARPAVVAIGPKAR